MATVSARSVVAVASSSVLSRSVLHARTLSKPATSMSFTAPSSVFCARGSTFPPYTRFAAGLRKKQHWPNVFRDSGSICSERKGFAVRTWAQENPGDIVFVEEEDRYYFRDVDVDEGVLGAAPSDFFELLNLDLGASREEVRAAYRSIQRLVHPDVVGAEAHDMAVLLNKAYAVLESDGLREQYAEVVRRFRAQMGGGFTGRPLSEWCGPSDESRAIFVDETTCIGCSHCSMCAPNTFAIEEDHGRARVFAQWGDTEDDIRMAIDICPVDCIYYVKRSKLALLEWILQSCEREDIAIMARRRSGNMGASASAASPFTRAEIFTSARQSAKELVDEMRSASQDEELAGVMARAFLALPSDLRANVWPEWTQPAKNADATAIISN